MQEVRCEKCNKMLFTVKDVAKRNALAVGGMIDLVENKSIIEIKCPRCKNIMEHTIEHRKESVKWEFI